MPNEDTTRQENCKRMRAVLLAELAARSEQGAKISARLANTDGPIDVESADMPPEFLQLLADQASAAALPQDVLPSNPSPVHGISGTSEIPDPPNEFRLKFR